MCIDCGQHCQFIHNYLSNQLKSLLYLVVYIQFYIYMQFLFTAVVYRTAVNAMQYAQKCII